MFTNLEIYGENKHGKITTGGFYDYDDENLLFDQIDDCINECKTNSQEATDSLENYGVIIQPFSKKLLKIITAKYNNEKYKVRSNQVFDYIIIDMV